MPVLVRFTARRTANDAIVKRLKLSGAEPVASWVIGTTIPRRGNFENCRMRDGKLRQISSVTPSHDAYMFWVGNAHPYYGLNPLLDASQRIVRFSHGAFLEIPEVISQ